MWAVIIFWDNYLNHDSGRTVKPMELNSMNTQYKGLVQINYRLERIQDPIQYTVFKNLVETSMHEY
jgi:hypothetical protein